MDKIPSGFNNLPASPGSANDDKEATVNPKIAEGLRGKDKGLPVDKALSLRKAGQAATEEADTATPPKGSVKAQRHEEQIKAVFLDSSEWKSVLTFFRSGIGPTAHQGYQELLGWGLPCNNPRNKDAGTQSYEENKRPDESSEDFHKRVYNENCEKTKSFLDDLIKAEVLVNKPGSADFTTPKLNDDDYNYLEWVLEKSIGEKLPSTSLRDQSETEYIEEQKKAGYSGAVAK
ncbi:hypothetical protein N9V90_01375 [Endozoicomonas sp.]|nr:hypothetical protein [Endozoicomonas sp.]